MIVALFDADGTLYSAAYGRGLMKYALSQGRKLHVAAYFASLIPAAVPVKLRLTHSEAFDRLKVSRMTWLLRGWTDDQVNRAFQWVTDEYLMPTRRPHVIQRLKAHQEQGHLVLIASATFTPSLRILADRLGVQHFIGSGIETRLGRYTGRFIPPVIKGADKLAGIHEHLGALGAPIDWAASYAYGDSYSDRQFMQLVGHPVAVHPEHHLRLHALEKKWEILESDVQL